MTGGGNNKCFSLWAPGEWAVALTWSIAWLRWLLTAAESRQRTGKEKAGREEGRQRGRQRMTNESNVRHSRVSLKQLSPVGASRRLRLQLELLPATSSLQTPPPPPAAPAPGGRHFKAASATASTKWKMSPAELLPHNLGQLLAKLLKEKVII